MPIFRKIYTIFIDLAETLVIAGAIFVVIYAFLFRPFQVNGQSMHPNYENGEYVLTNLITLRFKPVKRGDEVMIKAGFVFVDDIRLDESEYLALDVRTYAGAFIKEGEPQVVPPNSYFALGDNRSFSSDSREWGFVASRKRIGKSFLVYWPVTESRLVKHAKYNIN